jgi:hypothetical protein
MKKCIFSFIVACLSLTSSLITIQAAAQDNLTEGQVRNIVTSMTHNQTSDRKTSPASSLYGPRFEIIPAPDNTFYSFKFDKETGDTWVIESRARETTSKLIGRDLNGKDESRPGEINYQLLVKSWTHVILLNVNTGAMWEAQYRRGSLFSDFKEIGN